MQQYTSAGIIGPVYSGKTEIRGIFARNLDYEPFSFSQLLREEVDRRKMPLVRDSYTQIFREWAVTYGYDILARRMFERMPESGFVLDGIRQPAELEYLRKHVPGFLAIGVDVSEDREQSRRTRYARLVMMQRGIDVPDWKTFVDRDSLEWGGVSPLYDIEACMRLADEKVLNNGTLEDLEARIRKLIRERNFIPPSAQLFKIPRE